MEVAQYSISGNFNCAIQRRKSYCRIRLQMTPGLLEQEENPIAECGSSKYNSYNTLTKTMSVTYKKCADRNGKDGRLADGGGEFRGEGASCRSGTI